MNYIHYIQQDCFQHFMVWCGYYLDYILYYKSIPMMFQLLLGHLVGDYLLQNQWMALNKTKYTLIGWTAALVHCILYTLAVCTVMQVFDWYWMIVVFLTHFPNGIVISLRKFKQTIGEIPVGDDDVHGIFRGRDGKFFILGKVLDSNTCFGQEKPFVIPKLDQLDEIIVQSLVKNRFGVDGDFNYYFVTR